MWRTLSVPGVTFIVDAGDWAETTQDEAGRVILGARVPAVTEKELGTARNPWVVGIWHRAGARLSRELGRAAVPSVRLFRG